MNGLTWIGPEPAWESPTCDGCNPPADRALFARLAAEIDDYLAPQPDQLGGVTVELATEGDK